MSETTNDKKRTRTSEDDGDSEGTSRSALRTRAKNAESTMCDFRMQVESAEAVVIDLQAQLDDIENLIAVRKNGRGCPSRDYDGLLGEINKVFDEWDKQYFELEEMKEKAEAMEDEIREARGEVDMAHVEMEKLTDRIAVLEALVAAHEGPTA